MDGDGFDALARTLANRSSRRGVMAALAAAFAARFARTSSMAAQGAPGAPPGGSCATDGECRQDPMLGGMVCADNGFGSDGPLNCCATSGCCTSDADCCGDYRCAPAPDVCDVCRRPPFPTRYIGEACAADTGCVPPVVGEVGCVSGRCAFLDGRSVDPPPQRLDPEAAMAAAEGLSRLEVAGQFDALYDRMHPDARAVVPRPAVVGWYETEFAPRGPQPAEAVKVRFVPWAWGVTGATYPETAEVAFRQRFADGTVVRDEVRLVKDQNGDWAWFFGRDRAFVEAQIARFGGGA